MPRARWFRSRPISASRDLRTGTRGALQHLPGDRHQQRGKPGLQHRPGAGRDDGRCSKQTLPAGVSFEFTELTYQQILAGNSAVYVFPVCVLLVFLVLAAFYESLTLPLAIVLIVPMCLFSALIGVNLIHGDNNIMTQIGLIVLVGWPARTPS
jgi:hypothetical protein